MARTMIFAEEQSCNAARRSLHLFYKQKSHSLAGTLGLGFFARLEYRSSGDHLQYTLSYGFVAVVIRILVQEAEQTIYDPHAT
jgi:hypothetical protein